MKTKIKSIDWEEKYKRALADLTRCESSRSDENKRAAEAARLSTILEFLPLIDDIERAISNTKSNKSSPDYIQVLSMLLEKANQSLKNLNVERIEIKKGDKPDLQSCDVIGVVDDEPEGAIAEIIETGYRLEDLIVRPSRVIVCRRNLAK